MRKLAKHLTPAAPKLPLDILAGESRPGGEWFAVTITGDTAHVFIFGQIGWTRDYRELLARVASAKDIRLTINSLGGNTAVALELFHALQGRVSEARIIERCWSAAVPVALAAKHIAIERAATVMLHQPCVSAYGTADQLIHAANHLKKCGAFLRKMLIERTELPEKIVGAWLHGATDSYFSSEQAVAVSLADSIFDLARLKPKPSKISAEAKIEPPVLTDSEIFTLSVLRYMPTIFSADPERLVHEASVCLWYNTQRIPKENL